MTWLMRSLQRNDFFDKSRVVKSVMTSLEAVKERLFEEPNTQPQLVTNITFLVTCGSSPEGRPHNHWCLCGKKKFPTTRLSPSRPLIGFFWLGLMPWKTWNSPLEIKSASLLCLLCTAVGLRCWTHPTQAKMRNCSSDLDYFPCEKYNMWRSEEFPVITLAQARDCLWMW